MSGDNYAYRGLLGSSPYCDRQFQQLRAQGQSLALRRREVDLKTHSIAIHEKLDHSAAFHELGHVADRQDARGCESRENLLELALFGGADKEHPATGRG